MKTIKLLFIFLLSLPGLTAFAHVKQKDSANWVENFRQFRQAIYQRDKAKAKSFVDFPILNYNNEIWYLAYDQNDKLIRKLPESVKPFTEQDFDKYFDKIFSKRFINCLLKIKTDELYKTGEFNTPSFDDSASGTMYEINATFDKSENTIVLILYSQADHTDDNEDSGEFSIDYYFTITKNGHIKFKQIRIAG
ncbi:MAG TPA: hypothetical protein VMI12_04645 [Puia sp.]|nr:hypothetical protein [Puia sp.]